MHRVVRLVLTLVLLAGGLAGPTLPRAHAESLVVFAAAGDSSVGSLGDAIASAGPGDTITFAPHLSGQTITLEQTLPLANDLTIDGLALADPVTVSDGGKVCVFQVPQEEVAALKGLVIADGWDPDHSGGIDNAGTLTVVACTFTGNAAGRLGGGIFTRGALAVSYSTFAGNSAGSEGGGPLAATPI